MSTKEDSLRWRASRAGIKCVIDDCPRGSTAARGMCPAHYRRWRDGLPVDVVVRQYEKRGDVCAVEDCDRTVYATGWCKRHYMRVRSFGVPGPAHLMKRANGEGSCGESSKGYHVVSVAGRRRSAHRLAMESLLGRDLLPKETVHHRDGQRSNNHTNGPLVNFRSGNLELWSSAQPAGQRVADKVEFAVEILRQYAPHLLTEESPVPLSSAPGQNPGMSGLSRPDGADMPASADVELACEQAQQVAEAQCMAEGHKVAMGMSAG